MPQAQIIGGPWVENGLVCLAVAVDEGGRRFEYIGRVPVDGAWADMTNAQKKAALVAACKAARDATVGPATSPDAGVALSGTVSL